MNTLSVANLRIEEPRSSQEQLSAIENLPQELLQQIFDVVVSQDGDDLAFICLVSRYWRLSAIGHPVLWTYEIPFLTFRKTWNSADPQTRKLQLCIARSGSLPLSLGIRVRHQDWADKMELVLASVSLVTDECHRWRAISLNLPVEAWDSVLSKVRGKTPLLEKLDFFLPLRKGGEEPRYNAPRLDHFAEAPSLHDASIDMYKMATDEFTLVLPWSQLTSFDGWLPRCNAYRDLVSIPRPRLKRIKYQSTSNTPMPAGPSTSIFPNLTGFYFSSESEEIMTNDFASHLDTLTLPSLTHLEIIGSNAYSEVFTRKLLSLVQRSHCPLYALDVRTNVPPNNAAFMTLLSLCPSIEDLSVREISAGYLRRLVLDPAASKPMLPNLRNFRISVPVQHNLDGELQLAALDVPEFMCMVESRTLALEDNNGDASTCRFKSLQYVHLYGFNSVSMHSALVRWECQSENLQQRRERFNSPSPDTADDALVELAASAETAFTLVNCYDDSSTSFLEFEKMCDDAESTLRELEAVDLEKVNSSIFIVSYSLLPLAWENLKASLS